MPTKGIPARQRCSSTLPPSAYRRSGTPATTVENSAQDEEAVAANDLRRDVQHVQQQRLFQSAELVEGHQVGNEPDQSEECRKQSGGKQNRRIKQAGAAAAAQIDLATDVMQKPLHHFSEATAPHTQNDQSADMAGDGPVLAAEAPFRAAPPVRGVGKVHPSPAASTSKEVLDLTLAVRA